MTERARDANVITRKYMDSVLIEERFIDAVKPSLKFELFGENFDSPIMMAAFSHLRIHAPERENNGMAEYTAAARNMNMVNWVGMIENDEFGELIKIAPRTIRIVKPYADRDKMLSQFAFAEKAGALAVGTDIDHVFGNDGEYDVVNGELMDKITQDDLKNLIKATSLPVIAKGVLSVHDAVKCAECGVKGIVVSHHHGRMPFAIPPLMALPEIVREVGGKNGLKIFVDSGINTGADAYKVLALGADAVSVGCAILPDLKKSGTEGVEHYIKKMNQELATIMGYTGCATIHDFDPSVLWINGKQMK